MISRKRSQSPPVDDDERGESKNGYDSHDSTDGLYARPSSSGLHQRHPTTTQQQDGAPVHDRRNRLAAAPYKDRAARKRKSPMQNNSKGGGLRLGRWIRSALIAGIPAYIVATIFLVRHLTEQRASFRSFSELAHASTVSRRARAAVDHREAATQDQMQAAVRDRARQRRNRAAAKVIDEEYIYPYTIFLSDQEQRDVYPEENPDLLQGGDPAQMEHLCGFLAQSASLGKNQSQAFVERDVLTHDARVVITGILNPVGCRLALALKERCGVQVITGLDAMFPNTVQNRLGLLERIKMLTRNIPKLSRPILNTFVGMDPHRLPRKTMSTLPGTGELDFASFRPTHIIHLAAVTPFVSSMIPPEWKNLGNPYVTENYDPAFYAIRSSLAGMEQILASIAQQDVGDRPHFLYASSNLVHNPPSRNSRSDQWHARLRLMDELLADHYYNFHGVYSVAMRLPNTIYGPWFPETTALHRVLEESVLPNNSSSSESTEDRLDLMHVDDVVDTLIAGMQFREPSFQPVVFGISSGGTLAWEDVHLVAESIRSSDSIIATTRELTNFYEHPSNSQTRDYLAWEEPSIPLQQGLTQTMAWYLDQTNPFGTRQQNSTTAVVETGDRLLERRSMPTCAADDILCHGGQNFLPCNSDCSIKSQCRPSLFDSLLSLTREVTDGCDIVLYTQELGQDIADLRLHSEYMVDGDPLICNFAFVSKESPLVESVIKKVPDSELKKLGVEPSPEDQGRPDAFHKRKLDKLNGRLLFRGWILLWPEETPKKVPEWEASLIKISPGAFFSDDVKYALFVDQSFTVSPNIVDIQFLVSELHREAWPSRLVKRKTRPKAKFLLPAEPERRAVVLLSELKFQESSKADRLPSDTKISVYEATRFMRFENGEEPLGKEPPEVKAQRDFYDKIPSVVNREYLRSPSEPMYKVEFSHWARTRWVIHDLQLEEARLFRCDWYQEHHVWESSLDQLSLAFTMAKRDIQRKMAHQEPDDSVRKSMSEKTEMKKLLSDAFEWHSLQTEQNKQFSPYEEMKILPYEIDYVPEQEEVAVDPAAPTPLFARIISDRIMSYARKSYNDNRELEAIKKELAEKKEKEEAEKAAIEAQKAAAEAEKRAAEEKERHKANKLARLAREAAKAEAEKAEINKGEAPAAAAANEEQDGTNGKEELETKAEVDNNG